MHCFILILTIAKIGLKIAYCKWGNGYSMPC